MSKTLIFVAFLMHMRASNVIASMRPLTLQRSLGSVVPVDQAGRLRDEIPEKAFSINFSFLGGPKICGLALHHAVGIDCVPHGLDIW